MPQPKQHDYRNEFLLTANRLLAGRTIKEVRYQTAAEAEEMVWENSSPVLVLDNGVNVICMRDDEGNDAGAMMLAGNVFEIIPVVDPQ